MAGKRKKFAGRNNGPARQRYKAESRHLRSKERQAEKHKKLLASHGVKEHPLLNGFEYWRREYNRALQSLIKIGSAKRPNDSHADAAWRRLAVAEARLEQIKQSHRQRKQEAARQLVAA
jgi:hypothetical protein